MMPNTKALLKAYGQIPIPDRLDEITYQEAAERGFYMYDIHQALLKLYERDCQTIKEDRGS